MVRFRLLLVCAVLVGLGALIWRFRPHKIGPIPTPFRLTRPGGMAPAAFDGFVRACNNARIHPQRVGQTVGDHPLSVGYHRRDGWVKFRGQNVEYTAAVDLGTSDLSRAQINRFLEALAAQGFAAWYREKGKWRFREYIHAIYAPLPMKPQLRGQVRQWLRERERDKRYPWQSRWKHRWQE